MARKTYDVHFLYLEYPLKTVLVLRTCNHSLFLKVAKYFWNNTPIRIKMEKKRYNLNNHRERYSLIKSDIAELIRNGVIK